MLKSALEILKDSGKPKPRTYNNGEEELYDHRKDPDEFHNIADKPESEQIKLELKRWLPTFNASEDKYIDSDKKKSGF